MLSVVAEAQFSAPFPLTQAGPGETESRVAIDPQGNAVVVWRHFDGIRYWVQARSRSAAGLLGPVQNLSSAGQEGLYPFVGIAANGEAVISWYLSNGTSFYVQVRARSASGILRPIQTLLRADHKAFPSPIGVDADGNALIAWWGLAGTNYRVAVRARSATGVLSPIQTLSQAGLDAFAPRVAVSANGSALITWFVGTGTNYSVQARSRSANGVLGRIQTLSNSGQDASPELAIDPAGNAVVAWTSISGTNTTPQVKARFRAAAGMLGPILTLSQAGAYAQNPQVAIGANGDAVITWNSYDGKNTRVQAVTRSAAGVLGAPLTLSEAGYDALLPQVAVDGDGNALVTWTRRFKEGTWNWRVEARTLSPAGVLGPVMALSEAGKDAYGNPVAINANGDTIVTWYSSDGMTSQVMGAATP
jgi:hypothetical protein